MTPPPDLPPTHDGDVPLPPFDPYGPASPGFAAELIACVSAGQGYRDLADHIIRALNPLQDSDVDEVAVLCDAITEITNYVDSLPCTCAGTVVAEVASCRRCLVLGRRADIPVER